VRISSTTLDQNNELHEANEQLLETKPTLTDEQVREMEKTSTTVFPFLKEEALLSQIYELCQHLPTEASPEMLMEALRVRQASARKRNDFNS
jgi:hypothetical protein